MLQSFVLQNSSLSFKSKKRENVTFYHRKRMNWKTFFSLYKLVIRAHFKHKIQYVMCVTCEIRLILTEHCLI